MFTVNNKDTRTTSLTSRFSSVSIGYFEQVNDCCNNQTEQKDNADRFFDNFRGYRSFCSNFAFY